MLISSRVINSISEYIHTENLEGGIKEVLRILSEEDEESESEDEFENQFEEQEPEDSDYECDVDYFDYFPFSLPSDFEFGPDFEYF